MGGGWQSRLCLQGLRAWEVAQGRAQCEGQPGGGTPEGFDD